MTIKKRISPTGSQGDPEIQLVEESPPTLPDHAGLVHGCYVAVVEVRGTHAEPHYTRHVLFSLKAAQRRIDRATAAGLDASIVLCQLIPAGGDSQ